MPAYTDPAKELAATCDRLLAAPNGSTGYDKIASDFGVAAWSGDFYEIIRSILRRADDLIVLLDRTDPDPDVREQALAHVQGLKSAFHVSALTQAFTQSTGMITILREHSPPLRMLSPALRPYRYPQLGDEQIKELVGLIDQLLEWLEARQVEERDFIRDSLIEGLIATKFRLLKLSFMGWGYAMASLREVVGAYLALVRGDVANQATKSDAVAKKVFGFLQRFYTVTGVAKDVVERGDFLLRAFEYTRVGAEAAMAYKLITG